MADSKEFKSTASDEELLALRDRLAAENPEIAKLDLETPEARLILELMTALLMGSTVKFEIDGEEAVTFTNLGNTLEDQAPLVGVAFTSTDGTLSPDMADLAAKIMKPELDEEIDRLIRE